MLTDDCQGREERNRLMLSEVQAIVRKDMNADKISEERKAEALDALKESRKVNTMGSRSSNAAAQGDARGTVDRLTEEVESVHIALLSFLQTEPMRHRWSISTSVQESWA
jgi:hypothetical protein